MDVLDIAKQLGEAIQESEQYKKLEEADKIYQNDAEAQRLTEEYNAKRTELVKKAQEENVSAQEMLDIRQSLSQEFTRLSLNPVISSYIEAKKEFDGMMSQVDGIIKYYVTGEEQGCGGSCSTCGGCH